MAIYLRKSISLLTFIILAITLICSVFFRHDVRLTSNITDLYHDIILFTTAIITILCILIAYKKNLTRFIPYRYFYIVASCIITSLIVIAISFPVDYPDDFIRLHLFATQYFAPQDLKFNFQEKYFQVYPFQLNAATVFGIIYKITHTWRAVVLTGVILCILCCLINSATVYNITKSQKTTVFCFFLSLILFGFQCRTFIPYTDNYGAIFPCLVFFIYSLQFKNKSLKYSLIIILTGLGTYFKITCLIPSMAILFAELLLIKQYDIRNVKFHKAYLLPVLSLCVFALPYLTQKLNHFTHDPKLEIHASHYFHMGQNCNTYGQYCNEDVHWYYTLPTETRNEASIREGINRISDRGIIRNIQYYKNKLVFCWSDGLTGNIYRNATDIQEGDFLNNIFITNGSYYKFYEGILQTLWYITLILMFICSIYDKGNITYAYKITIIGVVLYLLIFENNPRYKYMFMPILLSYASIGLYYIKQNSQIIISK